MIFIVTMITHKNDKYDVRPWIEPISDFNDEKIAMHLPWIFVNDVCLINCIRLITTIAPNRNTITAIIEPNITINHVWVSISSARLWFIGCLQMRIVTNGNNYILIDSYFVRYVFTVCLFLLPKITSYTPDPIYLCADPIAMPPVCCTHRCRFVSQLQR